MPDFDVIVVGAGNAAHAAAFSARENGAERVLILEKAPEQDRGGNTHYSGGLLRIAFEETEELRPLVPNAEKEISGFFEDVEPYKKADFMADLMRVTDGKTDQTLANILIDKSYETIKWMKERAGIPMEPATSLAAIKVGNRIKWQKGAIIRAEHEGVGLSANWFKNAQACGIEVRYGAAVIGFVEDSLGGVGGVKVRGPEGLYEVSAGAVVLGCGGFEANPMMRGQYLGAPWDHAKVRGTAYNQGDGLRLALEFGAQPWGQWTGRHSTPISNEWPDFADRERTDKSNRLSYPYGIMLNRKGKRFLDEGEDLGLYTYAKTGAAILEQSGAMAWQIFDQQTVEHLEGRYVTSDPITADTLDDLIDILDFDDRDAAKQSLREYNAAASNVGGFDPSRKDGLKTSGLNPEKTNWALPLNKPPFVAYSATGGITFTFGGVKVSEAAEVMGVDWRPIPGLFACGEMVGGLFHGNYPGGSGLVSGAVFGKIAGESASASAKG